MTTPLPWSYTSLSDFKNCPWQFHETRVTKRIVRTQGVEAKWGEQVHHHFEVRQREGTALPPELAEHEPYMARLDRMPGSLIVEQKIALNLQARPCQFFDKDVWFRGVVDWTKLDLPAQRVSIVDYKTGKSRNDFTQLKLFALHSFALHATINLVDVRYFWTQTGAETRKVLGRDEIPILWKEILPDLRQYKQAFDTNTWQKRQSGLCGGWCPVTDCEFWRPRGARR